MTILAQDKKRKGKRPHRIPVYRGEKRERSFPSLEEGYDEPGGSKGGGQRGLRRSLTSFRTELGSWKKKRCNHHYSGKEKHFLACQGIFVRAHEKGGGAEKTS